MNGRGERIRTSDSCVPNAVLYQAELHPEANCSAYLSLITAERAKSHNSSLYVVSGKNFMDFRAQST